MSAFVESLHEVFERFGRIGVRRMFGGHGLFHDGRMFALVAHDTLYLKVDAGSVVHFDALRLPAFGYEREGKLTQMSYREVPPEVFEDRDEAAVWACRAYEAALRSGAPPKARKSPPPAAKKRAPAATTKRAGA